MLLLHCLRRSRPASEQAAVRRLQVRVALALTLTCTLTRVAKLSAPRSRSGAQSRLHPLLRASWLGLGKVSLGAGGTGGIRVGCRRGTHLLQPSVRRARRMQ